jgi:Flp pilus assembly protein TadD/glycosyltransferase involved in cell wall biosynthesis
MSLNFETAMGLLRAGRVQEAAAACRRLVAAAPAEAYLFNLLGVAEHRAGQAAAAAAALRRAVRAKPDLEEAGVNLCAVLQAMGRNSEAALVAERTMVLAPQRVDVAERAACLAQDLGDSHGAAAGLRRAVLLNPFNPLAFYNLAATRIGAGDPAAAGVALLRAAALDPVAVGCWTLRGAAALSQGDIATADVAFVRALRLAPGDWEAQAGLLRCRRYRTVQAARDRADIPSALLLRGPAFGVSGYAHMTNRFVKTLNARGAAVHLLGLMGNEPWAAAPTTVARGKLILSALIPPAAEPTPGLASVMFSMFEGTRIPQFWLPFSRRQDLIIVPTRSSFDAWAERGFPADRLRICPLGVDPEDADGAGPVLPLYAPDGRSAADFAVRVLNVSDFIPRKNLDGLLRVWLRCSRADDDAVLILKPGKGASARAGFFDLLAEAEAFVGRRAAQAAPIIVVDQTLDEVDMGGLFRAAGHYWSMSHGEGWDLPMSRAGAMGRRLIAPDHSAYQAYLDAGVARMIPSQVGPAHLPFSRDPWPTFRGLDWWEPDEDAAVDIIGRIVRGEDRNGPTAARRLLSDFTWARATDRLQAILAEVGG